MSSNNSVKLISSKLNRIEEIFNNFYKNFPKRNTEKFSVYNAKFILNNVPYELEYDLTKLIMEELEKLVNFTTQTFNKNHNNNVKYPSSTSYNNDNNEKFTRDNNALCDLSNLTMKELEKLVNLTTHDDKYPSFKSTNITATNKKDKKKKKIDDDSGDSSRKGSKEYTFSFH